MATLLHAADDPMVEVDTKSFDSLPSECLLIIADMLLPAGGLSAPSSGQRGYGNRPVGPRATAGEAAVCAWMPPKECWGVEYTTQLEYEHERSAAVAAASPSASSPRGSGSDGGGVGGRCEELARSLVQPLVHAITAARTLAARNGAPNATLAAMRRRLRELPCDGRPTLAVLPDGGATGSSHGDAAARNTTAAGRAATRRAQLLELQTEWENELTALNKELAANLRGAQEQLDAEEIDQEAFRQVQIRTQRDLQQLRQEANARQRKLIQALLGRQGQCHVL